MEEKGGKGRWEREDETTCIQLRNKPQLKASETSKESCLQNK